jgi:hypothetical protein
MFALVPLKSRNSTLFLWPVKPSFSVMLLQGLYWTTPQSFNPLVFVLVTATGEAARRKAQPLITLFPYLVISKNVSMYSLSAGNSS